MKDVVENGLQERRVCLLFVQSVNRLIGINQGRKMTTVREIPRSSFLDFVDYLWFKTKLDEDLIEELSKHFVVSKDYCKIMVERFKKYQPEEYRHY